MDVQRSAPGYLRAVFGKNTASGAESARTVRPPALGDRVSLSAASGQARVRSMILERVGRRLDGHFGQSDLDLRDARGFRHSPAGTADRIVAGAKAAYETFKSQNPELEGEALMTGFEHVFRSAVEEGGAEALMVLHDLEEGAITPIGETTMTLVGAKLGELFRGLR